MGACPPTPPAGHGVDRSVSSAPLGSAALDHRDEGDTERPSCPDPPQRGKNDIARPPRENRRKLDTRQPGRVPPLPLRLCVFAVQQRGCARWTWASSLGFGHPLESAASKPKDTKAPLAGTICIHPWFQAFPAATPPAGHGLDRSVWRSGPPRIARRRGVLLAIKPMPSGEYLAGLAGGGRRRTQGLKAPPWAEKGRCSRFDLCACIPEQTMYSDAHCNPGVAGLRRSASQCRNRICVSSTGT
jgi:hypothetical protein